MANRTRRANGAGSVTTRSDDGALIVRVTDPATGRRVKRIVKRERRDDGKPETPAQHRHRAESVLRELKATLAAPARTREQWTIERWARERYLPSLNVAPTTEASYRTDLDTYVLPSVGGIELADLTAEDVDALDARLKADGKSLATRRHARGALTRVLRHAKRKGRLQAIVTEDADPLARDDRDRATEVLDSEQLRSLLASAKGSEWELPIAFLAMLGMRRSEVLGLGWDCINTDDGVIHVRRSMVAPDGVALLTTPKTARSVRTLGLPRPVVPLIRAHRARHNELRLAAGDLWQPPIVDAEGLSVDLLFTDEAGRPLTPWRLNNAVKRFGQQAGLGHVHPHLLRHSVASLAIAQGQDVAGVSAMLGHANSNVTLSVYTHAFGRTQAAATEAVADAVGAW